MLIDTFKTEQSILPNSLAFSFVFVGYALGVYMLFSSHWLINVAGGVLSACPLQLCD
jgi:hypothetical protein